MMPQQHQQQPNMAMQVAINDYLKRVRRGMFGVSGGRKRDVCAEIGADLEARIAARDGDIPGVISAAADPKTLGRAMRAVHGVAWWIRLFFWMVAPWFGLLSFPMIAAFFPGMPVNTFLFLGTLWVVWAASVSGRITGAITGFLVGAPRIIMVSMSAAGIEFLQSASGYESWSVDGGTIFVVILTSLLLPVLGFMLGKRLRF